RLISGSADTVPGSMAPLKKPRSSTKLPLALNPLKSKDVLAVLAERNQAVIPVGAWVEPAPPGSSEVQVHAEKEGSIAMHSSDPAQLTPKRTSLFPDTLNDAIGSARLPPSQMLEDGIEDRENQNELFQQAQAVNTAWILSCCGVV
uniref:Coiled-coil domain containing 15 n=1 Tax=Catagonus wagneri TaxID=51154 RepID=A0A8C3VI23_9CETA